MWGQELWGLEAQRAPFPERTATWEFLLDPRPPEAEEAPPWHAPGEGWARGRYWRRRRLHS